SPARPAAAPNVEPDTWPAPWSSAATGQRRGPQHLPGRPVPIWAATGQNRLQPFPRGGDERAPRWSAVFRRPTPADHAPAAVPSPGRNEPVMSVTTVNEQTGVCGNE